MMTINLFIPALCLLAAAPMGVASVSAAEKCDTNPKHQLPRTDAKAPPQPPTNRAIVRIDTAAPSRTYSRMIFGGFLEHFDNQIYGGVFEPGSPLADKQGFRTDVIAALKAM